MEKQYPNISVLVDRGNYDGLQFINFKIKSEDDIDQAYKELFNEVFNYVMDQIKNPVEYEYDTGCAGQRDINIYLNGEGVAVVRFDGWDKDSPQLSSQGCWHEVVPLYRVGYMDKEYIWFTGRLVAAVDFYREWLKVDLQRRIKDQEELSKVKFENAERNMMEYLQKKYEK